MYPLFTINEPDYSTYFVEENLPLKVNELMAHSRFDEPDDAEKKQVVNYIASSVIRAERIMNRSIMPQDFTLNLYSFPVRQISSDRYCWAPIRLLRPPVVEVTSVKYIATDGTQKTLVLDTDYKIDFDAVQPIIVPAYGKDWPDAQNYFKTVEVKYKAGYLGGAPAGLCPPDILQAITLMAATWYENREDIGRSVDTLPVPFNALSILSNRSVRIVV